MASCMAAASHARLLEETISSMPTHRLFKRYGAECQRLTNSGMELQQENGSDKLHGRGFV